MSNHRSHNSPPKYRLPTKGILSLLPPSWIPYAELMRIHRPAGIFHGYFPHLFGTLFSLAIPRCNITLQHILKANLILLGGTIFYRGAACSWNDTLDYKYDRQVRRCCLRPIARGALSPNQGHTFTLALSLVALGFLSLLPLECAFACTPSVIIGAIYPLTKRFTDFPQVVLGFQLAMGVVVGWRAGGCDTQSLSQDEFERVIVALTMLYFACVFFAILGDVIYAQPDLEDDMKAGVRSMAVRFKDNPNILLRSLSVMHGMCLIGSGISLGLGREYFLACGGAVCTLVYMISTIDLKKPENCAWWFKNGCWINAAWITVAFVC